MGNGRKLPPMTELDKTLAIVAIAIAAVTAIALVIWAVGA